MLQMFYNSAIIFIELEILAFNERVGCPTLSYYRWKIRNNDKYILKEGVKVKKKVEDIVFNIANPIVSRYNFELVDIEYLKEGPDWYLRVFIDKEGGITIDDCQVVSEELSDKLDEVDPIDHGYIFEVSSPGIDRPLKTERDYEKNIGKLLEVKFYKPYEGKKIIEGILKEYSQENVTIDVNGVTLVLNKELIALMKPIVKI